MARAPITHVATTDIADMMNPGPERRMELPGFDPEFVDFPHFIIRITERIWHDREVELCLKWYGSACAIHTLAGDIAGAQTVVDNTRATLKAFPDRRLDGDNVIWSDEGDGAFYSSHLITSKMTNLGASDFGPATGRKARVLTIADCLCKDNRVIEEWLVRDTLGLARQLGFDGDAVAAEQAARDAATGFSLISFHSANRARVASAPAVARTGAYTPEAEPARFAEDYFARIWNARDRDALAQFYDYRVGAKYPGAADLYGRDEVGAWQGDLFAALPDAKVCVEHVADIAYLGEARDIAVRWSLSGHHTGAGRYGTPSGAPVYILGVSHFRVMRGRIREEHTVFDDLAVRRQVETARRAP
jgi:predicted ester cyclase